MFFAVLMSLYLYICVFDVWFLCFSPPCEQVSTCRTTAPRNLPLANSLFNVTKEIIQYCLNHVNKDVWYAIENPSTGLLCKDLGEYRHITTFNKAFPHFVDLDYCRYSKAAAGPFHLPPANREDEQHVWNWEFPYQKQTRIWSNIKDFKPKKCEGKSKCHMIGHEHDGHVATYGNNKHEPAPRYKRQINGGNRVNFVHRLPPLLLKDLLRATF